MKLTNNTIKKTMNILEERKTVKENFSRMDSLQGSNAMEKAFAAVDLNTLMGIARPYLNDDEKEILKDEMLKIVMVLPNAELEEIYDTVVASVKGARSNQMKLQEGIIKATLKVLSERNQVEEGLLDRIKKGLGMSAKAKDNDQDVETAPETVQTPEIELFNPRLKLNDVTDEHLKVAADKIQRKHLSSLKSFERFTKTTMDKLSHDKEQTGKFAKLANYIYMEDYINIDHDATERDNAKEKEREDREYRRKRDAKSQAKKDRDTDYLRNIGRI